MQKRTLPYKKKKLFKTKVSHLLRSVFRSQIRSASAKRFLVFVSINFDFVKYKIVIKYYVFLYVWTYSHIINRIFWNNISAYFTCVMISGGQETKRMLKNQVGSYWNAHWIVIFFFYCCFSTQSGCQGPARALQFTAHPYNNGLCGQQLHCWIIIMDDV